MKKSIFIFLLIAPWLVVASQQPNRHIQAAYPLQKEFMIAARLQHPAFDATNGRIPFSVMDSVQKEITQWEKKYHLFFDRALLDEKIKSGLTFNTATDTVRPDVQEPNALQLAKSALNEKKLINGLSQYSSAGYMKNSYRTFYHYDEKGRYSGYVSEKASPYGYYWYENYRLLISYNAMDSVIEELYQYWSYYDNEWQDDYRYVYDWDENGNQTYFSFQQWENEEWNKIYEYIWSFNDDGNLIEKSYKRWNWYGDLYTYWCYRYLFSYDDHGNRIETIYQSIDTDGEWVNDTQWSDYYDENNFLTEEIITKWKNGQWENDYHWLYTYDLNGNVLQATGEYWKNEQWALDALWNYQYNDQKLIQELLVQYRSGNVWVNSYRYLYEYDAEGRETLYLSQSWWDNTWHDRYRYETEYDAAGNIIRMEFVSLFEDKIDYGARYYYDYDDNNLLILRIGQYYRGDHWANNYKYVYIYYDFGLLQGLHYFDGLDTEWKEEARYYYGYQDTVPFLPPIDDRPTEAYYNFYQLIFALGDSITAYSVVDGPDRLYINRHGRVYWRSIPTAGKFQITIRAENEHGSAEQSYTLVVLNNYPQIVNIQDVPDDQGGKVFISFRPSIYDADRNITQYGVWSKDKQGNWFSVGSLPAIFSFKEEYTFLAPTLGDSTKTAGQFWSYFKITAHLDYIAWNQEPFYTSPVDSGYSLDNLPPGVPENVTISHQESGILLTWDECYDSDFQYFSVYRNDNLLGYTASPEFRDSHPSDLNVYKIYSVDYAGNISEPFISGPITALYPQNTFPTKFGLCQNSPNPFNPTTTIKYALPKAAHVKLEVFNVLGEKLAVLVDGREAAGYHQALFNARNLPGGVYYYRLSTDVGFTHVRKMVLLK